MPRAEPVARADDTPRAPDRHSSGLPVVLARPDHAISRKHIAHNALKVLYRLHTEGHTAYLVGGSVRDLLLHRRPKDFDVATDARPNEIRRLFRNSRVIGRRFRLVHVLFRDSVVEVSTFRRDPDPRHQEREPGELLVTSDNTFGTPEEDAFRRDFTVNALFYSIADFSVIDYVGGLADLAQGVIRVIGDPDLRFKEDPVRMLRACEFAGRLGFAIDQSTQEAIQDHRLEITKASPARMTEELLELLRSGHSGATVQWIVELGMLELLLPELETVLDGRNGDFSQVLPAIDRAVADGGAFSDDVLLAALLVPKLVGQRGELEERRGRGASRQELRRLIEEALADFGRRYALSNLKTQQVFYTLETFARLCEPVPGEREAVRLAGKPSFGDALDLFELLVDATGEGRDVLETWQRIALDVRPQHSQKAPKPAPVKRRRGRRRRRR